MTLDEIALELGISHQAVWEIQAKAIKKLRIALQKHDITYEELLLCLKLSV
jgi:DNA-directed RNA polymerase sigma subunit (sigma70/sigma32)